MKTRLLTAVLAITAMALLALNWATRRPAVPAKDDTAAAESRSATAPLGPTAAQGDSVSAPPAPAAEAPAGPAILVNASGQPIFPWEQIESPDYRKYVSNLRAAGFPEELIRTIITADVDKLYEPREAALKTKPIPFDAPMAQRAPQEMKDEDWDRLKQLRDLRMEKQALLEQVLGIYVPREIMRSPNSRRNYESYEYALSLLPPEKREAVQLAQENEILKEGMQKATITDPAAELEAFKRSCAERDAALRQALTPDEFDRYEMHMEPVATELARCTIGMEPTESEFQAMFKIASKNWIDTGGVYGRLAGKPGASGPSRRGGPGEGRESERGAGTGALSRLPNGHYRHGAATAQPGCPVRPAGRNGGASLCAPDRSRPARRSGERRNRGGECRWLNPSAAAISRATAQ